jgi:hypothetical protein
LGDLTIRLFDKFPEYYLGILKENIGLVDIMMRYLDISKRDLYIVLFKVRRNESLLSIAHRFGLSQGRISQILEQNIENIAINLEPFIKLPIDKKAVKQNLPMNFRSKYRGVRHIIDCFETPIGKYRVFI